MSFSENSMILGQWPLFLFKLWAIHVFVSFLKEVLLFFWVRFIVTVFVALLSETVRAVGDIVDVITTTDDYTIIAADVLCFITTIVVIIIESCWC